MAKLICLQAGHEGVTTGATGAPGEVELNVRIRNRLSEILLTKKNTDGSAGFILQLVDANPANNAINKDYDLFLALHGDADIYGTGGGFVDWIDPSIDSSLESNAESKRIKEAIESVYFGESGIVNHPERSNANTRYYYMWSRLSAKTSCVIMEMGVVQDAHDKVILADTDRVAKAIARGICNAFSVPYDQTVPPVPMTTLPTAELEALKAEKTKLSVALEAEKASVALIKQECLNNSKKYRLEVKKKLTDLASSL